MRINALILFFLLAYLKAFSSDSVLVFRNNGGAEFIGRHMYVFKDSTGRLSIGEVRSQKDFTRSGNAVPNLGATEAPVWIRMHINNASDTDRLMLEIEAPLIDRIDFFSQAADPDSFITGSIGQYKPFYERKYKHVNYMFDLRIPRGATRTIYLKVSSTDPIVIPVRIIKAAESFESVTMQNFLFGMYAGLMIIMVLYNLFVYLTVRDKSYLYYVGYIAAVLLTQATFQGYTFRYLWPGYPELEMKSIMLVSIFVGFASVAFLRSFLNTASIVPRHDRVFRIAYILYAISIAVTAMGYHMQAWMMINLIVTPLSIYMLFVAIKIARKGYRTATFFTIAWSIFLIGVFIYALKDFGVLPYNYMTKYMMPVGSAIETILLSFALADRINILKKEKEESQAKTLEALKENERIVREQNIILEARVRERTEELQVSNKELSVALKNLKDAQTQLVDAEKMASLGQLTAGIAHEINNPINFVISNIKPLKRDIKDILHLIDKYQEIEPGDNVKEKLEEANTIKKEIDLSYLTEEINSLLKGIDEGATRTSEIIKGLRNFSRLDEGALKKVNVLEGLDSTLTLLNNQIREGKIKVVKEYDPLPAIDCFPGKLNQVFMNILNNAIHAIKSKKLTDNSGQITLKAKNLEDAVEIRITDNGTGIPSEVKAKIFEPFFTTKNVGEGTGLGLSIAYNIIEKHKGRIFVESETGIGTEFIIRLPLTISPHD
jgi:two-component system, NtrC family, sensor kinase